MKKSAFTMIELVFVIVVLGILASVAIPRFAATRDDAHIAKGRSDVATIRAAIINERQGRLFRGDPAFITTAKMDTATGAFGGILPYPIATGSGNGKWGITTGGTTYTYSVMGVANRFDYNATTGTFNCTSGTYCSTLTD